MAMIKCPECGTEISTRAFNCIKCGLPMSEIFVCPECNNVMLRDNNTACDKCGCPIDSLQTIENNPALELNINISKPQEDKALSELNYLTTCERIIHKVLLNNPLNGVGLYYEGGNPISDGQKVNAVKIAFNIPKSDNVFFVASGNMMSGIDENMKGFALSSHGIYFKDDDKVKGSYFYDEFVDVHISSGFGYLYLSKHGFNITFVKKIINMFYQLKAEIRDNFKIS